MSIDVESSSHIFLNGTGYDIELLHNSPGMMSLKIGDKYYNSYIHRMSEFSYEVWINEHVIYVTLENEKSRLLGRFLIAASTMTGLITVRAPMPGLVSEIIVKPGEFITSGKSLLILEAMKMENEIRSVSSGRVKDILVERKSAVEKNQPLMIIEASEKE